MVRQGPLQEIGQSGVEAKSQEHGRHRLPPNRKRIEVGPQSTTENSVDVDMTGDVDLHRSSTPPFRKDADQRTCGYILEHVPQRSLSIQCEAILPEQAYARRREPHAPNLDEMPGQQRGDFAFAERDRFGLLSRSGEIEELALGSEAVRRRRSRHAGTRRPEHSRAHHDD
jgi:hypothetical protein